jgi:hypothetical protein
MLMHVFSMLSKYFVCMHSIHVWEEHPKKSGGGGGAYVCIMDHCNEGLCGCFVLIITQKLIFKAT